MLGSVVMKQDEIFIKTGFTIYSEHPFATGAYADFSAGGEGGGCTLTLSGLHFSSP